jgi:hypothetical protein
VVIISCTLLAFPALSQADGEHESHDAGKLDKQAATAQAIAAEENIRRVERWRYVQPFFPFVRKWTSFFLNTLKCMKSAALRLKYNDLGDFIFKMGIMDVSFGRYMQRGWTHQVGYVRERFTQFSQAYVKQMSELHLKLKTFLEVSDWWRARSMCCSWTIDCCRSDAGNSRCTASV